MSSHRQHRGCSFCWRRYFMFRGKQSPWKRADISTKQRAYVRLYYQPDDGYHIPVCFDRNNIFFFFLSTTSSGRKWEDHFPFVRRMDAHTWCSRNSFNSPPQIGLFCTAGENQRGDRNGWVMRQPDYFWKANFLPERVERKKSVRRKVWPVH